MSVNACDYCDLQWFCQNNNPNKEKEKCYQNIVKNNKKLQSDMKKEKLGKQNQKVQP